MSNPSKNLLDYIHVMVGVCRDDHHDDTQLLARFVEARDERAFTTLLWRHGPMVWRTCTRVLGDGPDAEDAFQATFLALARKAGKLRGDTLAGWLHRVARQTAVKADTGVRRQRSLEQRLRAVAQSTIAGETDRAELYAALDEELTGLPERLRVPLVLRYLESKTQDEVASILGCSRSVALKRLARGEVILRQRLERRGLTVGIGTVAVLLGSAAGVPAMPTLLVGNTVRAALRSLSFPLPLESFKIGALAEGVMKTMLVTKMKIATVLLGLTLCLAGGGLLAYQALAGNTAESPPSAGEPRGEAGVSRQPGAATRVDCFGDPLPAHALARMGTTRLWYGRGDGWPPSRALAFSPDGKTLATHIDWMTVCLWDTATGKEIRRLTTEAVKGPIASLGFSPAGKTLIAMDDHQTVCWWEVATGKFLRKQEYQGPKRDNVIDLQVAFLADGKMLGFGNFLKSVEKGKTVRGAYVWDVATGKEICQLNRPLKQKQGEGGRGSTVFSPDGKLLVTTVSEAKENGGKRAILCLWDLATGKEIRQLVRKDGGVDAVAFSPDGRTLATGEIEKICVWEVATGKRIHLFPRPQEAVQADRALDGPLTYSPDGKTLVGGRAGHLWDMGTGKEIRSFGCSEEAQIALFSPNGKTLAVGDGAGAIRLWEVATGKEIGPRKGFRGCIQSVAYSSDGKTLASLSGLDGDRTVRLWQAATGKEIRQLAKGSCSVTFSPDSKMFASTMSDGVLHLWDTATGKEIRQFQPGNGWSLRLPNFSPDGKKLAARMTNSGMIYLWVWEVATGKKIYSLSTGNQDGNVGWLFAFSPDGRMLAADDKDNTVCLWEVATGARIGQLGGLKKPAQPREEFFVRSLAFSPDGRMLARSGLGDDKIHLWEVASSKEICQLGGLKDTGRNGCTLAFSPDGMILATAAQGKSDRDGFFDPKVRLWEVASGKEIGQLAGHQAIIRTLAFSPDGKTLASGSDDLTCLVWDIIPFVSRMKPAPALPKEQLEATWADLAKDPAKAYAAIWALQAVPTQAISLLQARVQPVAPLADIQQLQRWIADLDDDSFAVREKAQREIKKLGESAIPALRQALKGRPTLEACRGLQNLLTELELKLVVVSPTRLRELRAVQVLESIGTAEARQVLQAWAKGVAEARLTREADAALAHLAKRSAAKP